ncbi:MAG: hypothetical protein ACRD2N_13180 [Vicinamibacterales bacterium]
MPERRFRPGDVLDDYCPHERRITDHAIVAMIDDEIRRTRCVVCDSEHQYKAAKVPTRRKTAPVALFTQVLDGLQGPTGRPPSSSPSQTLEPIPAIAAAPEPPSADEVPAVIADAPAESVADPILTAIPDREDGPVRRSLIRAQFPRTEGQPPAPRSMPEFTVHSLHNRGGRNGNHSHRGGGSSFRGPMRFGRDNGQPDTSGRPHGQRHRRRRGGKKHQ